MINIKSVNQLINKVKSKQAPLILIPLTKEEREEAEEKYKNNDNVIMFYWDNEEREPLPTFRDDMSQEDKEYHDRALKGV